MQLALLVKEFFAAASSGGGATEQVGFQLQGRLPARTEMKHLSRYPEGCRWVIQWPHVATRTSTTFDTLFAFDNGQL
jgi:hypothetical protein